MEELFANLSGNLSADTSMFDPESVLTPTFDPTFIDQPDIYEPVMPPNLRNPNPSPSPAPPTPANPDLDSFFTDPDDPDPTRSATATPSAANPVPSAPPTPTAPPAPSATPAVASAALAVGTPPVSSAASFRPTPGPSATATTDPTPSAVPAPSAPDAARRALLPVAQSVVVEAWRANANPAHFVSAVRTRLPLRNGLPSADDSHTPATPKQEPMKTTDEVAWQLPSASEGAILDALFAKLVNSEAASTRLMSYLSYTLVTGMVSQRSAIATCLSWVAATPHLSARVLHTFTKLMARVLPHYRFDLGTGADVTAEVREFLAAFTMIVKATAADPALAPDLVTVLAHDRVVALVRACARRVPSSWQSLDAALAALEVEPSSPSTQETNTSTSALPPVPTPSAMTTAPQLKNLVAHLKRGLCVGITSLESITSSIGNLGVQIADASLPNALKVAFAVTLKVFGTEVATAMHDLWSQREGAGGDLPLLLALERAAKPSPTNGGSGSGGGSNASGASGAGGGTGASGAGSGTNSQGHSGSSHKYGFRNKVQAAEAIVRFLAERSSVEGSSEKWKQLWGGKERVKRIIVNAIPQVRNEIRSETGALIVSMAVTCCSAMCLGPALRMSDPNDGVELTDQTALSLQQTHNDEVEDAMGELISFAVNSLEEAATAEEVPLWRSFGLWLLLLMSRAGSMLRASGCDHARAARVLRAWGGMPTGTPGSHTSSHSGSAHKHSSQSGTYQQSSSSSSSMTEGVTMFAGPAALAIIDVSDVNGNDATIGALCDDLVQ